VINYFNIVIISWLKSKTDTDQRPVITHVPNKIIILKVLVDIAVGEFGGNDL